MEIIFEFESDIPPLRGKVYSPDKVNISKLLVDLILKETPYTQVVVNLTEEGYELFLNDKQVKIAIYGCP
jgi:hypothetical protein